MAVNHYWYRNSQAHIFKVVGSGRVNNSRLCPGAKRSGERVHNALHCGMLAVLDFDPVQRTAGRDASRPCPPAPSDKRGGTGQGQSRPARSRSGRYRPHAAPAAVRGWPCASTAAGRGDPRHRSPGCRRRRTRPRHIEDEGGVAITQRMARVGYGVVFPDLPGYTAMGRTLDLRHGSGRRMGPSCLGSRARDCEALRDDQLRESGTCGRRWRLAVVPFERGKPARGEYLASQPARWQRSARERPHMYAVLTFN